MKNMKKEFIKRDIQIETTDIKETQKVEYLATKQEEKKVKNQILCNK